MSAHTAECTTASLAEIWPNETKPDHLTDYQWNEIVFCRCAPDCPVMEAAKERGRELAKEHGW